MSDRDWCTHCQAYIDHGTGGHPAGTFRGQSVKELAALRAELAQARADLAERDAKLAVVMDLLKHVTDHGLIYWEPQTSKGRANRALMFVSVERALATLPEQAKRLMEVVDAAYAWANSGVGEGEERLFRALDALNLSRPDGDGR